MADMSWRFEYWILYMMKIWNRYDQDVMMQIWRITVKTIMIWWQCEDMRKIRTSTIEPTSFGLVFYTGEATNGFSQVGQQYRGPGMVLCWRFTSVWPLIGIGIQLIALQWSGKYSTNWYFRCFFWLSDIFGVWNRCPSPKALIGASGQSCLGEWIRFALESQGRGWDAVGRCSNVKAWQSKLTDLFQTGLWRFVDVASILGAYADFTNGSATRSN